MVGGKSRDGVRAFLKALSHVQSVVERRTTIPILSNVLLRAHAGQLALSATDMDVEIVERVAARIERDGQTTAPAHTLYEIVRKLPEGSQVTFESTGESGQMTLVELKPGAAVFVMALRSPDGNLTTASITAEKDGVKPPM